MKYRKLGFFGVHFLDLRDSSVQVVKWYLFTDWCTYRAESMMNRKLIHMLRHCDLLPTISHNQFEWYTICNLLQIRDMMLLLVFGSVLWLYRHRISRSGYNRQELSIPGLFSALRGGKMSMALPKTNNAHLKRWKITAINYTFLKTYIPSRMNYQRNISNKTHLSFTNW